MDKNSTPLISYRSSYQLIELAHHPKFGNQLYLNGDLQISESDRSYNVAMVSPLILLGSFSRVTILGSGDGGVLKERGILSMQCCGTREYDEVTGVQRERIMDDIYNALRPHFRSFIEQRVFIPSYQEAWTFLAAQK